MASKGKQPAARLGDIDTGHPPSPPTPIITASSDVIINGRGAARKGDMLAPHHPGVRIITEGSNSVLINGRPAARVTDSINCGGKIIIGSDNVFIGDNPQLTKPTPVDLPDITFSNQRDDIISPKPADNHKSLDVKASDLAFYRDAQQYAMLEAISQDKAFVPLCDKMKPTQNG